MSESKPGSAGGGGGGARASLDRRPPCDDVTPDDMRDDRRPRNTPARLLEEEGAARRRAACGAPRAVSRPRLSLDASPTHRGCSSDRRPPPTESAADDATEGRAREDARVAVGMAAAARRVRCGDGEP